MQPQQLQNTLRVRRQGLVFRVGAFRRRDLNQLHFVELMHADDAARLPASRARFAAKARRVGDEFLRQLSQREDFLAMKIRHRHFRRGREEHLVLFQPVHVFLKLRQLRRPDHAIAPHQKRRTHFQVTVLARVQVEHELNQRPLQFRPRADKTDEPRAAQLRRALEVE